MKFIILIDNTPNTIWISVDLLTFFLVSTVKLRKCTSEYICNQHLDINKFNYN